MGNASLFSRAHAPRASAPKRVRGFLALPGEIRNQIYQYYFDAQHHCEVTAKGCQFNQQNPRTVKLWLGLTPSSTRVSAPDAAQELAIVRFSRPLGKYNAVQGLQTNWLGSMYALSLVCKQVYMETAVFLYHKTVFIFDAPKRMANFFSVVSTLRLESITTVRLHYNTYGHPQRTEHLIWQNKHGESWHRACKAASRKLVGLQELEVWVQIHDSAPKFSLREKWVAPLLQFRRLVRSKQLVVKDIPTKEKEADDTKSSRQSTLNTVKVHIRSRWSKSPLTVFRNNKGLARASTNLHLLYGQAISRAIMGAREEEAMAEFNAAWGREHTEWRYHLQFAATGW